METFGDTLTRKMRERGLDFTDAGQHLMLDMLEIVEEIAKRFISLLGSATLTGLRTELAAWIGIRVSSWCSVCGY